MASKVHAQSLTSELRTAFPSASIHSPVELLGEGFGSIVVATADGFIFRVAKHAAAQAGQRREQKLLRLVSQHELGLLVPEIEYALESTTAFPFGVVGYRKLPGRPLMPGDIDRNNRGRIADQVARFLVVLHGVDAGSLTDTGLPRFPLSPSRLATMWQTVSPYLAQRVSQPEHRAMQRWQKRLLDYDQDHPYQPSLVHGDLWYENLLFAPEQGRLVGVIDFENASIGDPALDLATQFYLGEPFARAVIDAYYRPQAPPGELATRMARLMGLRELLGLEHGMMVASVDPDSVAKVRAAITAER